MYSKTKNSLLYIGPLPPPRGGVSIHIERLSKILNNDFIIDYIDDSSKTKNPYFNFRTLNIFKYFSIILKSKIVHIHSGVKLLRYFHILSCRILNKKIVVTYHRTPEGKRKEILIESFFLRMAHKVVFVNKEAADLFSLKKPIFFIKDAFIPPELDEEPPLDAFILNWIKEKNKNNTKIISGNAWKLIKHQGNDLYGLDLLIDLIKHLKDNKYNVCCIFTVSNIDTNDSYFKHCKDLIKKNNIENNFLLISGHHSFPRIITKSDIIIRPTTTDGDALTIREALWFNKSIIASNVVKRPQGTIIFKNRDLADLIEKVVNTINEKTHTSKQNTSNYTSFYLSLYNLNKNDRT